MNAQKIYDFRRKVEYILQDLRNLVFPRIPQRHKFVKKFFRILKCAALAIIILLQFFDRTKPKPLIGEQFSEPSKERTLNRTEFNFMLKEFLDNRGFVFWYVPDDIQDPYEYRKKLTEGRGTDDLIEGWKTFGGKCVSDTSLIMYPLDNQQFYAPDTKYFKIRCERAYLDLLRMMQAYGRN